MKAEKSAPVIADDTVITVTGEAREGSADTYTINLSLSDEKWIGHEPGNASRILAQKAGTWDHHALPNAGTTFINTSGAFVIELVALNPGSTRPEATGRGHATQAGVSREVNWRMT